MHPGACGHRHARCREFQFPSNGKAHVHKKQRISKQKPWQVSIPFKRESTCALYRGNNLYVQPCSFNSLQTGKHMCTENDALGKNLIIEVSIPFKRESTCARNPVGNNRRWHREEVSIPFKRESTCAPSHSECIFDVAMIVFQFPSNGKAHVHREGSTSEPLCLCLFQFPSNGKAHVHF